MSNRSNRELDSLNEVSKLFKQLSSEAIITETSDIMAHYDLGVQYNYKFIHVEVKERMNKYAEIKNFIYFSEIAGWQCENIKYDFLINKISRYVNYFQVDDKKIIIIWNLTEISKNDVTLNCPATTSFSNNKLKEKEGCTLLAKQGTTYVFNTNTNLYQPIDFQVLKNKLLKSHQK